MKSCLMPLFLSVLLIFLIQTPALPADDKGDFSTAPNLKNGTDKWRIGYYEGGDYIAFQQSLASLVRSLMELGWIDKQEIPPQTGEQTRELWKWLATALNSRYIEFAEDAHYTLGWDRDLRAKISGEILDRLNTSKDIDLMIAAGTWAGQDLANEKLHTPTVVIATANPLQSGIIKSVEDSGHDFVHARIAPLRFERQLQLFHDVIGFRKLGVVYEDTPAGRTYAAMDDVEKIARERGFEIVRCPTRGDIPDAALAVQIARDCYAGVAKEADAVYVTAGAGVTVESLPEIAKIINSARVPSFAQDGAENVKYGCLMSISTAGYKYVGQFYAETIAKILNGAKPRRLNQLFEDPPKIAINLEAAALIGYDPPMDILSASDEIFTEIAAAPAKKSP